MNVAIVIDIFHDKGNGTSMSARHLVENLVERGIGVKCFATTQVSKTKRCREWSSLRFPYNKFLSIKKSSSSNTHGLHLRTTRA